MREGYHVPVLQPEAVSYLVTEEAGVYVDGTLGGGGHAESICKRLRRGGQLIGIDADEDAIQFAATRLEPWKDRVTLVHSNFRTLKPTLGSLNIALINGLLLDLGVSSFQLDEERGFSFRTNETIDMRMDKRQTLTGAHVINTYDEQKLAELIWKYGEERNSRRIAYKLVNARPIRTTGELAHAIELAVGSRFLTKTLARVFQAIRICTNDELHNLEKILDDIVPILAVGGRIVVISYHSLEDRIVKQFFRSRSARFIPSGNPYVEDTRVEPQLKVITKSPVLPSEQEIVQNPRSRSAKMRVAERC